MDVDGLGLGSQLTSASINWVFLGIFHVSNFMTTVFILNINTQIFAFHTV